VLQCRNYHTLRLKSSYLLWEFVLNELLRELLAWLSLPEVGLPTLFVVGLLAATILPFGSEPVFLAYVASVPHLLWPAILVATAGNTLGGVVSYWMGTSAHGAYGRWRARRDTAASPTPAEHRAERWIRRLGPAGLFFAWLPIIGDPLCLVAGWSRLSFWPCVAWMALGKFLRYAAISWLLTLTLAPN
jgi:membrane protein YqaA with SNARE-associated domain